MLMVDAAFMNVGSFVNVRASFSCSSHATTRTLEYDHAGRLLKTFHRINSKPEVLITRNDYNELGQLIDKKLHSVAGSAAKQSVDYRYNIRGWLTAVNDAALTPD